MGGTLKVTVQENRSGAGNPDLIAFNQPLRSGGRGAYVWDVKPATDYGFEPASVTQLQRYVEGLTEDTGEGAEKGPDVRPDTRYNPDDNAIYVIFSGPEWKTYARYDKDSPDTTIDNGKVTSTGAIAGPPSGTDVSGLIFYARFKRTKNKEPSASWVHAQDLLNLYLEQHGIGMPIMIGAGDAAAQDLTCQFMAGVTAQNLQDALFRQQMNLMARNVIMMEFGGALLSPFAELELTSIGAGEMQLPSEIPDIAPLIRLSQDKYALAA